MNNPFDRVNLGLRERPLSSDFNRLESQLDRTLRDVLRALVGGSGVAGGGTSAITSHSGFIGDGMRVVPASPIAMSVQVSAGFGFIYDALDLPFDIGATDLEGVDDRSSFKPVYLNAPAIFTVPTAPGPGLSRIDIIEVKVDRRLENLVTRRQLDTATKSFLDHMFYKTLAFSLDGRTGFVSSPSASTVGLSYKIGAEAATGAEVEPSTTSGYVKIGRINVAPSVVTIDTDALVDRRPLLGHGGMLPVGASWRVQWNAGAPIHTLLALDAPAGLQVALGPLSLRGAGSFYVVGGEITRGTCNLTASHQTGHSNTNAYAIGLQGVVGTGVPVTTVDASLQTALAAATPPIDVGIGTKVLQGRIISRYLTNTGASDNTDTSLEDAIVQGVATVSYLA